MNETDKFSIGGYWAVVALQKTTKYSSVKPMGV
jgi:hypothetical protein